MNRDKKTVITVEPKTHKKIKVESARRGISTRQLTSLLLDYSLGKLKAGEIDVATPAIEGGATA